MADEVGNYFIEFYLSLVAYYVLHMIFVIAGDFIEAFSIPPLNIGIYIDKLAAIRALLMVIADALEYGFLSEVAQDKGRGNYSILKGHSTTGPGTEEGTKNWLKGVGGSLIVLGVLSSVAGSVVGAIASDSSARLLGLVVGMGGGGVAVAVGAALVAVESQVQNKEKIGSPRRLGSIVSFIFMLACRLAYLVLVYTSDNKSLSVFITLCLEGFWFGVFQNSFFAIGAKYNAVTSLGIHTMGNFIFAIQVILNRLAKKKQIFGLKIPTINSLSRVRVHAWTIVVSSIIAIAIWVWFCLEQNATDTEDGVGWKASDDQNKAVWPPMLLFPVGAFAKDLVYPGILPFAFLDPERANLVNYVTPSFFMAGASVIVVVNDLAEQGVKQSFKKWSTLDPDGLGWNALWLLNVPKYLAFFIAMFGIHGIFPHLRCIVQCRWRVMLLTMFVVVPRAILEVAGYVGVANYAISAAAKAKEAPGEGSYDEFKYITAHDVLAMFCRFTYGKLAVGYK